MINMFLFLTLIVLLGILFQCLIGQKGLLEKIGNGILLGIFFMTVTMLVDYQISSVFNIYRVILFLCIVIITMLTFFPKRFVPLLEEIKSIDIRDKKLHFLLFLITTFLLSTLVINLVTPISDWDAIALYDFRAKIISTGSWEIGIKLGYFFHYPPFTSLLHASAYLLGFEKAKIFYSILFLGFLISFYSLLRRRLSSIRSLFATFLITVSPLLSGHILIAYTNLPYSVYFCLAIIYTWEWLDKKNNSDLVNALIYLAASLWIRQAEPFWIVPIIFIIFQQIFFNQKKSWTTLFFGLLLFLGMYKYWPVYVASLNLPAPTNTSLNDGVIPEKISITFGTILRNLFLVIDHLIQYFIMPLITSLIPVGVVILLDKKLRKEKYFLLQIATIFLFFIMVVGGTFLFSFTYATWNQIGGSLTRMIMFFEPLLIYMIMFSNLWFLDNYEK